MGSSSNTSSSSDEDEEESNRKKKRRMKKKAKKQAAKKKRQEQKKKSSSSSSSSKKKKQKSKDFEQEVAEAMAKQEATEVEAASAIDDRKRGYNSLYDNKAPTEAEMEAYYRKRSRDEDPMKHF